MKTVSNTSDNAIVIVERGEELISTLTSFAANEGLKSACLSGLGGASSMALGYYNPRTKEYQWQGFNEPLEILSLTGNMVTLDGQPFWHIHGVFSRDDFTTIGGHVKELVIGLTGEIHITKHQADLTRNFDKETGLKLIDKA